MFPRRALLIIDVQNEYFDGLLPIAHPPLAQSLPNLVRAAEAAEAHGVPVVLVRHAAPAQSPVFADGGHGGRLHPRIAALPHVHRIDKRAASAFTGTDLAGWLVERGIDTLTIAGYMTHNCDAATILDAAGRGLKAEFLADASGSLPYANAAGAASAEEIHRVFSVVLHSGFAAVASTERWIEALAAGAALAPDNIMQSYLRAGGRAA